MSTIRKRGDKWQSIIRISGHPDLAKSFVSKTDAKRWATQYLFSQVTHDKLVAVGTDQTTLFQSNTPP